MPATMQRMRQATARRVRHGESLARRRYPRGYRDVQDRARAQIAACHSPGGGPAAVRTPVCTPTPRHISRSSQTAASRSRTAGSSSQPKRASRSPDPGTRWTAHPPGRCTTAPRTVRQQPGLRRCSTVARGRAWLAAAAARATSMVCQSGMASSIGRARAAAARQRVEQSCVQVRMKCHSDKHSVKIAIWPGGRRTRACSRATRHESVLWASPWATRSARCSTATAPSSPAARPGG